MDSTPARLRGDVVFQENSGRGAPSREVRAHVTGGPLEGDRIGEAMFGGGVSFKERGFDAGSYDALYKPGEERVASDVARRAAFRHR